MQARIWKSAPFEKVNSYIHRPLDFVKKIMKQRGECVIINTIIQEGEVQMSKVCPKCGREFMSSRTGKCPICEVALVEGVDNSEAARKERLRELKERELGNTGSQTRQNQSQSNQKSVQNQGAYRENQNTDLGMKNKPVSSGPSGLSIAALIFSFFGCLSFVGTILAIIDLCIKDGKKKICSVIALIITFLWCFFIIMVIIGSGSEKPKAVTASSNGRTTIQQADTQSGESSKDTFGLMETAEMNDIQVTMTNYKESAGSEWNSPASGNVFVLVEFEIVNNSDSDLAISSMLSFEAYADDYAANSSLTALLENDQNQLDGSIASGKRMRGWVGYEVPSGWRTLEVHFTDNVWSSNKFKFFVQK